MKQFEFGDFFCLRSHRYLHDQQSESVQRAQFESGRLRHQGNLTTFGASVSYSYDVQNRLISATNGGTTETFKYDGLNRQVSRKIGTNADIYSVWDGWNLIEEIQSGSVTAAYLSGVGGLVKNLVSGNYYYQDASGSTSHLASSTGQLLEWYRYDLQGTPVFYNASNTQLSTSNYSIRHLFTGQQWYSEIGLYDLRNRFYSPDLGRFLQPDPIGFAGDPGNIYRYCGNNAANWSDPFGLAADEGGSGTPTKTHLDVKLVQGPNGQLTGSISATISSGPGSGSSGASPGAGIPGLGGASISLGGYGGSLGGGNIGGASLVGMGGFRGDIGGGGGGRGGGFNIGSGVISPGPTIPIGPPAPDIGIVPGLGPFGSTPIPTALIPDAPSLEALFGPQPPLTLFVGFNFHAIGGSGLSFSIGAYLDTSTFIPTPGNFISAPTGPTAAASARGFDPSVSLTGGFVKGSLSGPFGNRNFGLSWYSAGFHYNSFGQWVGFSNGVGISVEGLPTYSETNTTTYLFPMW